MAADPTAAGQTGTDVLIVGAGPTGLSLAAQLAAHGVRPRLIDTDAGPVPESRALAIQPRTLEVLAGFGVTDRLVAAGNPAVRLQLHAPGRDVSVPLFDLGLPDTAYPYLLLLSQAETEQVLIDHLATVGVTVDWQTELVDLRLTGDSAVASLRCHGSGAPAGEEVVAARYVAGCDGPHSAVRRLAGIPFRGGTYPRTFLLADLAADGVDPGAAHAHLSDAGIMFFFPLVQPAPWRLLAMRPAGDPTPPGAPVTLAEVQALADAAGTGARLHDPVWMTNFQIHHRAATAYRRGRVFLAGDAAHIHSPAGAQGMNTGIQDSVNLGWKLAQAVRGRAGEGLLDSYQMERLPVGQRVLRMTDRAFTAATSTGRLTRFLRTRVVPRILPLALGFRRGRAYAFRTVSQLRIRYRRSPLSVEGPDSPRSGPRAGDRLPDVPVPGAGGPEPPPRLHGAIRGPGWHLLLCGPPGTGWDADQPPPAGAPRPGELADGYAGWLTVHRIPGTESLCGPGAPAHYLIRPDGHVGYRAGGTDLTGVAGYLRRWLGPGDPGGPERG